MALIRTVGGASSSIYNANKFITSGTSAETASITATKSSTCAVAISGTAGAQSVATITKNGTAIYTMSSSDTTFSADHTEVVEVSAGDVIAVTLNNYPLTSPYVMYAMLLYDNTSAT